MGRLHNKSSTNSLELQALEKGLQIAVEHRYLNLTVEGDSNLIITVLHRLLNDTPTTIVIKNWRLAAAIESTGSLLPKLQTVHPSHIHRKANKLADRLANEGVHLVQGDLDLDWDSTPNN